MQVIVCRSTHLRANEPMYVRAEDVVGGMAAPIYTQACEQFMRAIHASKHVRKNSEQQQHHMRVYMCVYIYIYIYRKREGYMYCM